MTEHESNSHRELEDRCREAEAKLAAIYQGDAEANDPDAQRASEQIVASRERDERFKRTLRVSRDINRLILRATDRERLVEQSCAYLTEYLGYPAAGIVLVDHEGRPILTRAMATKADATKLVERIDDDELPPCLAASLRTPEPIWQDRAASACQICDEVRTSQGFSCLSRQLQQDDIVYGAMVVVVPTEVADDVEHRQLLFELVDDIGAGLQKIDGDRKRVQTLAKLRERVKELNCLYRLDQITLVSDDTSIDGILADAVELLPESWLYPEDAVGRIVWNGRVHETGEFSATRARLVAPIHVFDEPVGTAEVGYRDDHPAANEGPFLGEERDLIDSIAERLGRAAERLQTAADLRRRESLLARTESLAQIGSWEWEICTDTVIWSDELFRFFGIDPSEGPPTFAEHDRLYVPDDLQRLRVAVEEAIATGKPYEILLRATTASGEVKHCMANGYPERGPDGSVARLVGYLRDVSEREAAREMSSSVFAMASELICVADLRTNRFLSVNPAFERALGIPDEDLLSRSFLEFIHPDDVSKTFDVIETQLRQGVEVVGFENRYRHADGSYRILDWRSHTVPEEGVTYAIARDVTAERMASSELRESEELFRLLAANTIDVIWRTDLDANIQYVNPACEALLGYPPDEVIETNLRRYFEPSQFSRMTDAIHRAVTASVDRILSTFEADLTRRDGSRIVVEINGRIIRDELDEPTAVQFVTRDITRRKQLEDERHDLENQLAHSRKLEAVGRLAGGVAHDFNNLLMVISNYCDMLQNEQVGERVRGDLAEIRKASDRAADLTRQLLAFSRQQVIEPKIIDVNRAVRRVQNMMERLIGEDVCLEVQCQDDIWLTRFDPGQAEQILVNLTINARDAMPDGGKLTIETRNLELDAAYSAEHPYTPAGRYVMIAVSDDGVGMDAETESRAFEPFFTTKGNRGSGLGLSTVFGIVKQHGGSIELYSEVGQGTTIKIYLPTVSSAADDEISAPADRPVPQGTETILLIEDEPAVRRVTTRILERLGYRVVPASSPSEAIEIFSRAPDDVHLVFTDVVMPEMSGKQCVERLAELKPDLRALFMSGYTENVIAERGVLEVGIDFVSKPFSADILGRKIRDILDR